VCGVFLSTSVMTLVGLHTLMVIIWFKCCTERSSSRASHLLYLHKVCIYVCTYVSYVHVLRTFEQLPTNSCSFHFILQSPLMMPGGLRWVMRESLVHRISPRDPLCVFRLLSRRFRTFSGFPHFPASCKRVSSSHQLYYLLNFHASLI
jgi:hypothetical protein